VYRTPARLGILERLRLVDGRLCALELAFLEHCARLRELAPQLVRARIVRFPNELLLPAAQKPEERERTE
jgi:hypothetical protein